MAKLVASDLEEDEYIARVAALERRTANRLEDEAKKAESGAYPGGYAAGLKNLRIEEGTADPGAAPAKPSKQPSAAADGGIAAAVELFKQLVAAAKPASAETPSTGTATPAKTLATQIFFGDSLGVEATLAQLVASKSNKTLTGRTLVNADTVGKMALETFAHRVALESTVALEGGVQNAHTESGNRHIVQLAIDSWFLLWQFQQLAQTMTVVRNSAGSGLSPEDKLKTLEENAAVEAEMTADLFWYTPQSYKQVFHAMFRADLQTTSFAAAFKAARQACIANLVIKERWQWFHGRNYATAAAALNDMKANPALRTKLSLLGYQEANALIGMPRAPQPPRAAAPQGTTPDPAQSARSAVPCVDYNTKVCTWKNKCRFTHICSNCNKSNCAKWRCKKEGGGAFKPDA